MMRKPDPMSRNQLCSRALRLGWETVKRHPRKIPGYSAQLILGEPLVHMHLQQPPITTTSKLSSRLPCIRLHDRVLAALRPKFPPSAYPANHRTNKKSFFFCSPSSCYALYWLAGICRKKEFHWYSFDATRKFYFLNRFEVTKTASKKGKGYCNLFWTTLTVWRLY